MEISELSSKLVWHFCCKIGTVLFYSSGYNIPSLICDPIIYMKLACFTVSEIQIFLKTLNVVACDLAYLTMGLCIFAFLA